VNDDTAWTFDLSQAPSRPRRVARSARSKAADAVRDGSYTVGLLINPRSFEIATATYDSESIVQVHAVARKAVIAEGTIDADGPNRATRLTNYPRAHSSPGVSVGFQRQGWGTVLYAAEAVSAGLAHDGKLLLARNVAGSGAGVCSDPTDRLRAASAWWDRAVASGLATSMIERSHRGREKPPVDMLTRDAVVEAGLVVAGRADGAHDYFFTNPPLYAYDAGDLARDFAPASLAVLRVVNVGYLAHEPEGRAALTALLAMLRRAGGTEADAASMIERFQAGADLGGPQRNPTSLPTSTKRHLQRLHERRATYGTLAALP
jgi:hypothetical protein